MFFAKELSDEKRLNRRKRHGEDQIHEFEIYQEKDDAAFLFVPDDQFTAVFGRAASTLPAGQVTWTERKVNNVMKRGIFLLDYHGLPADSIKNCKVVHFEHLTGISLDHEIMKKEDTGREGLGREVLQTAVYECVFTMATFTFAFTVCEVFTKI